MKQLFIIALLSVFLLTGMQTKTSWEYKFESNPREKKVNELASQGWELVAIDSGGYGVGSISTYVFKRAKP